MYKKGTIMKEFIRKNTTTTYGYEHVMVGADGAERVVKWLKKSYDNYLFFATTSCGRKCVAIKLLDAVMHEDGDTYEVTAESLALTRTSGIMNGTIPVEPKKPLEDYLDEDDKAVYLALVAKAKKNREIEEARKKVADIEKEIARLRELEAQMATLKATIEG